MSAPFSYFSKASQMSAVLKRDQHALRMKHPEYFVEQSLQPTAMDKQGKVVALDSVRLRVLSPRGRHEFSHTRPKSYHF